MTHNATAHTATPAPTALEQSFRDIIAAENLRTLGVQINTYNDGEHHWTVHAHWDGFARRGLTCEHGYGDTIADALAKCIAKARAERTPFEAPALADEALPELVS